MEGGPYPGSKNVYGGRKLFLDLKTYTEGGPFSWIKNFYEGRTPLLDPIMDGRHFSKIQNHLWMAGPSPGSKTIFVW